MQNKKGDFLPVCDVAICTCSLQSISRCDSIVGVYSVYLHLLLVGRHKRAYGQVTQMEYWSAHEQTKLWVVILLWIVSERRVLVQEMINIANSASETTMGSSLPKDSILACGVSDKCSDCFDKSATPKPLNSAAKNEHPIMSHPFMNTRCSWIPSVSSISTHQTFCSRLQLYLTDEDSLWHIQTKPLDRRVGWKQAQMKYIDQWNCDVTQQSFQTVGHFFCFFKWVVDS